MLSRNTVVKKKAGERSPAFLVTIPSLSLLFHHLLAPVLILQVVFLGVLVEHSLLARLCTLLINICTKERLLLCRRSITNNSFASYSIGCVGGGFTPFSAPFFNQSVINPVAGSPRGAVSHSLLVPMGQDSWLKVTSRTSM